MDAKQFIKNNYHKMTLKEIMKATGLSQWKVDKTVSELIKEKQIKPKINKWTEAEENYLAEHYGEKDLDVIAETLARSKKSIIQKVKYMRSKGLMTESRKYITQNMELTKKVDEAVNRIYKKLISEPQDKGIGDKKFDLILIHGQAYKITKKGLREGQIRVNETFVGKFIQETEDCIVFKNKYYPESFLKKDYLLGEIEIKEV